MRSAAPGARWAGKVTAVLAVAALACNAPAPEPRPGGEAPVGTPQDGGPSVPADPDPSHDPPPADGLELESTFREPSPDVVALVDARPTPHVWVAPTHDRMALADYDAHPSIELVSRPFERLAGMRIDTERFAERRTRLYETLTVVSMVDATKRTIELPEGVELASIRWSHDGTKLALTRWARGGVELWVADATTGQASRVGEHHVSTLFAEPQWMPDGRLLVFLVDPERGPAPRRPTVPAGPTALDTSGAKAVNRTYQDLLRNRVDEALFRYYATSRLAIVSTDGAISELGAPDLYTAADPSPDGQYVLVTRMKEPFSYTVPWYRFARVMEVRDRSGKVVRVVADQPTADEIPIEGVRQGARDVEWQPTADATLSWKEALDGGDPAAQAEHRDRLMIHAAPFADTPIERLRTKQRLQHVAWTERKDEVLATEYDRDRRWVTTHWFAAGHSGTAGEPAAGSKVIFDRSAHDAYGDPGRPVYRRLASGHAAVIVDDGKLYLSGSGATPDGDRPFLASFHLASAARHELMRASGPEHLEFEAFASGTYDRWLVVRESADSPPDYWVEGAGGPLRLTELPHPHPQLSSIQKRVLKYTRKDGVALSGTLYLPPGYDPQAPDAQRLPLVVWAYPMEYNDPDTAGQVRAAPNRFTRLSATSPLMFLTQGYAVLSGAAMPVVGDPETMNDTFLTQVVASAQAAVDAVVAEGIADPERVGVGGHSYGAFMTANLLAHSDIFRAGVARSGAYNRSLTPFGFQSERRTLWEAPDTYVEVSPLFSADKIDEPILLIHGEVDSNAGTFPLQSQRLFHALQGTGGTARLVMLPAESHGYAARESVLHTLAEEFEWFDKHVKNAEARGRIARPG